MNLTFKGILIPGLYYLGMRFRFMSRLTSITIVGTLTVLILIAEVRIVLLCVLIF